MLNCSTIIIIRNNSSMLLSLVVGILLILQSVEAHLVKSSTPYQEYSHQEINLKPNDGKTLIKKMPNKHNLKHYTTDEKKNVVQYVSNWPIQNTMQKQLPNISHKNTEKGVKENIQENGAYKQQFLNNAQNSRENYNILQNNKDFGLKMNPNSFENHKAQQEPSFIKAQYKGKPSQTSLHQQSQSQFINLEEKALYLQFVEAFERLMNYFSASKTAIQNQDTINGAESHLNQGKQDVSASEIQPSNIKSQSSQAPQEVVPPVNKKIELQISEKMINDTKMMAKARKKLYFIICTLSFGATCIFLIKLLQGRQEKNIIYSKDEKVKIPTEDFYTQQI